MSEFMLIIRDDVKGYSKYSPHEIQKLIEQMMAWSEKLKNQNKLRGGEKLKDEPGRTVAKKNGRIVVDGPFTETKELVGGYYTIEAKNYDEASSIAKECPALEFASQIDVREIEQF